MERSFALVLTVVTLVTATPHGYGVKGGASAKAEASAVAGTFGDLGPLPLSIPSGAAYSGSFSKSSSSSFASSSASSSSSSYSFSGSGANGVAGIGIDKGCSSGSCPVIGGTSPSSNGAQQFTGANAVSAAQAKAVSGGYSPCQGAKCSGTPAEKCSTGQCPTDSALKDHTECTSGNCQPPSPSTQGGLENKGSSEKEEKEKRGDEIDDSNDFSVNFNRKPQSNDFNGQHSNKDKSYDSVSDCSNGKCGPANSYQSNLDHNRSQHSPPATYLTTPKEQPPCTTANCNTPPQDDKFSQQGPETGSLPSSYNVPLQSATNPPNTYYSPSANFGKETTITNAENSSGAGGPCRSPNCNSTPYSVGTASIPNQHFGQQGSTNLGRCASGRCANIPSPSNGKTPTNEPTPGENSPNYSHGGIVSNLPTAQPGCKTRNCADLPTYSSLPTHQPSANCNSLGCSGTVTKPSDSGTPTSSGRFGGSAGFLDKTSINAAHSHGYGVNGGFGSAPIHGSSGATKLHEIGNYPTQSATLNGPSGSYGPSSAQGAFGTTKPNELHSDNHGFTQISNNDGSIGGFDYNKPNSAPATLNNQVYPSYTSSYGPKPTSSLKPLGSASHLENTGINKPALSNTASSPYYSGSRDSSTQSSLINSGSNSIQGSFGISKSNIPSNSQIDSGYTGNFGGSTGTPGSSSILGSTDSHHKPGSGSCVSPNCKHNTDGNDEKPTYAGGFGGPAGFLKPNDFSIPANAPTLSSGNAPCVSGICGSKSSPPPNQHRSLTNSHNLASATATASANAAAYSGGFGGPPGLLKPYDDGKVNNLARGNLAGGQSPISNSGTSGNPPVNGKNLEPASSAIGANAGAHASASASANAGGYGGNNNYQNNNGGTDGCNSGCNTSGDGTGNFGLPDGFAKNGLGAGSIATAKSSAGAHAYGGSFASSSASAHATVGAPTKGGYGRK